MSESKSPFPDKFTRLQPFMQAVVEPIKADLKKHHLKKDPAFVRQNFSTTNVTKVPLAELVEVYRRELPQVSEQFGEWLGQMWMLKHTEVYEFFERVLSQEVEDFTEVDQLPDELSQRLRKGAVQQFGAVQTYVFVLINDVVLARRSSKSWLKRRSRSCRHVKSSSNGSKKSAILPLYVSSMNESCVDCTINMRKNCQAWRQSTGKIRSVCSVRWPN